MEENITATICGDCGALISYNILTYRNAGHGGASCGCKKENYKILFGAEASAFLKNYAEDWGDSVRIKLDDGAIIYGHDCWWTPIEAKEG